MSEAAKHVSKRSESALTPVVRGAYLHVHEKRTKRANGAPLKTPRYDLTLIVPKLNPDAMQCANYAWLSKHCMDAAVQAWGQFPAGGHWPIQDGDAPAKAAAPLAPGQAAPTPKEYPWRKGNWIIEATNYMDPGPRVCVVQNGQVVEIPARVVMGKTLYKSGDFVQVMLHAWTFHNEKFGVNFGFEGVCFVGEGEAIGNSGPKSAAQMFGGIGPVVGPSVAPQPGFTAPVPGVAPPPAGYAQTAPSLPAGAAYPSSAPTLPPIPGAPQAPQMPAAAPMPPAMPAPGLPPFPGR
jgi:hypothetical protein